LKGGGQLDSGAPLEEQFVQMKTLSVSLFCMLVFGSAVAQAATAAQSPAAQTTSAQAQMPAEIEVALKKYVAAYERHSMQDLVTVWPDLQNQKKEFQKIKQHFDDGNVSNEHMSLHPLQTQTLKNDAIVQCERTEQFAKLETLERGGDLGMGRYPTQNPGPGQATKPVKKKDKVWMKLHKDHDDWVIVAVSQTPLTF
jgi:aspartate oxidase